MPAGNEEKFNMLFNKSVISKILKYKNEPYLNT